MARLVRRPGRLTFDDRAAIAFIDEEHRTPQPASTVRCDKRCHAGPDHTRGLAAAARYAHIVGTSFTPADILRLRRTADAAFTDPGAHR